jgi:hypothetical protein
MKAPKPPVPRDAPPGTVWFGGPVEWSHITLRIRGDDLDPDEISRLLGRGPDMSHRRGAPGVGADGTVARAAKTGAWHLDLAAEDTDEWDCSEAMMLLMKRLPTDTGLWRGLAQRFSVDLFVGLRMRSRNKGFGLSPEVMAYLGERGIEAGFDIYCDADQEGEPGPAPE